METRSHRRSVVATGIKFAYTAPLVAASMRLTADHARAAVSCPASTITVSGTVTDATTGAPLLAFLDFPGAEVHSDATGAFVLPCLITDCPTCGYSVEAEGYVGQFGVISTLGLTDGAVVNFQLVPL